MKTNEQPITGVLHHNRAQENYQLRRYFSDKLSNLVEQYWLVNWDLGGEHIHTQKNLPDPNPHLFFDGTSLKLLGPVSKVYQYQMQSNGAITGVKFAIGALAELIQMPMTDLVDKELIPDSVLPVNSSKIIAQLQQVNTDEEAIEVLEANLSGLIIQSSEKRQIVENIFRQIKHNNDIHTVAELSSAVNLSTRTIQRYCQQYIGLSPKWLLRKYRLHQMLAQIEQGESDVISLVERRDYTDQAHLIKDMQQILGITPSQYLKQ